MGSPKSSLDENRLKGVPVIFFEFKVSDIVSKTRVSVTKVTTGPQIPTAI